MKALRIAAAVVLLPTIARADVPVIDITGAVNAMRQFVESQKQTLLESETVSNTMNTVREVQNTVSEVQRVYGQAQAIYNAASHISSIGGAYSALAGQLGDPLGSAPFAIENLLNARTPQGALGGLGALGTAFSTQQHLNTVWLDPTRDTQDMQAAITRTSASQAIGERLTSGAQDRLPAVQGLVDQLAVTKDPADREALMIRLQGIQAQLQAGTLEALGAQQMALASEKAQALREQQRDQKSVDDWANQQLARVGWK